MGVAEWLGCRDASGTDEGIGAGGCCVGGGAEWLAGVVSRAELVW